ncbi:MAG: nicotinate-nucleotide diphosphorylase (carboxylating) [Tenericutes bacterium HGW-Tenericutes-5]|nr:MAG: nicotinate-nucleotide diphosphorylase (carboxylating) [Tenericutes bacterium HGW-Tenericutes-5]
MDEQIKSIVKNSLKEDIPRIDVSSEFLFSDEHSIGKFIAKEKGVISGIFVCEETFKQVDQDTIFTILKKDGEIVKKGDIIATVEGRTKSILMAERVALNFLQRMSGIATMTNKFVEEIKGFNCKILDTRKTTPLLRILEKQAVKDGGGVNHRMSLSDMVMLKDNHLKAASSIIEAVKKVRNAIGKTYEIEVEVENLEQFKEALKSDCNIIMLDNMNNQLMKECVELNKGKKRLEASGNMSLRRVKSVAETGVDYISVGSLTHSYKSLDISLKF